MGTDRTYLCNRAAVAARYVEYLRLGQVVDVIVGDAWWFERDELRKKFD